MTTQDHLPSPPQDEAPATPASTREALFGEQQRRKTSIRSSLLQGPPGNRRPGRLRLFVRDRRLFALQLYLLLHCMARGDPWDYALPAASWARALDKVNPGAEATVSRSWAWLSDQGLVVTEREPRQLRAFLRDEATGAKRTRPKGGSTDPFFYLPFAFFTDAWHSRLSLPGTVVLLIALDLSKYEPWFELRTERSSVYYDISADTLRRGLDELQEHALLRVEPRLVREAKSRTGVVQVNAYALLDPFRTPQPTGVIRREPSSHTRAAP